jgi:hypothetical protein
VHKGGEGACMIACDSGHLSLLFVYLLLPSLFFDFSLGIHTYLIKGFLLHLLPSSNAGRDLHFLACAAVAVHAYTRHFPFFYTLALSFRLLFVLYTPNFNILYHNQS